MLAKHEHEVSEETTGELIELLVEIDSLSIMEAVTNIEHALDKAEGEAMANAKPKLKPEEFEYQRRADTYWENWDNLETEEELERMLRMLGNAYVNVQLILDAMHDGLQGRTPFTTYRAIPIDADSA